MSTPRMSDLADPAHPLRQPDPVDLDRNLIALETVDRLLRVALEGGTAMPHLLAEARYLIQARMATAVKQQDVSDAIAATAAAEVQVCVEAARSAADVWGRYDRG